MAFNSDVKCPNCLAKINTRMGGMQTGAVCQYCGVALSGKVDGFRRAITVEQAAAQTSEKDRKERLKSGGARIKARRKELIRAEKEAKKAEKAARKAK